MKKNILVTGGAGFIGSHLVERLLKEGNHVVVVDNFDDFYDDKIKEENLRGAGTSRHSVCTYEDDIRSLSDMISIMDKEKINCVIHLAGLAGVRPSINNPQDFWSVNCDGTASILEAMRVNKIKEIVFASSSSVYGDSFKAPFAENMDVSYPISPYAATKRSCELMCHTYSHLHKINCLCIRFFTVYGPRQRPDLAIHKFAKLIMDGKPIPFYGDGSTSRDYTYVDDIVDGICKGMGYVKHNPYNIINLGESNTITLSELVSLLSKNIGKEAIIDRLPMQPGDVNMTCADITRAKMLLGYYPKVTKEEGIKKFIKWLKEKNVN